jgi:hypothetical protein
VLTVIDRDARRARRDAAMWLSFYYVARPFHAILDLHGWETEKQAIVTAFRSRDPEAMAQAVSERMWDQVLALAGTPEEVRSRRPQISALGDHVVLLAPAPYGGLSFERYRDNHDMIFEVFGKAR